ncbi:hypothetical protein [uncultured Bacteroides sp.]|uniref:hypothetical protein n=1 Tax=uncultured Bacteroides sp. TaxID=162156 RepID=UPI00280AE624|nr:hypothetical protein [uncultured Bacteroides sp.]
MNKWKIFAFLSIITLMTLFIGGNLYALNPNSLQETSSVGKQATSYLHSQSEDTTSRTVSLLISNGKAHIPHKFLCVQAQKEFDGKFFLTACGSRESLTHTPPLYLCTSYQKHSKHPYTHLNRIYYLYTLEKILI